MFTKSPGDPVPSGNWSAQFRLSSISKSRTYKHNHYLRTRGLCTTAAFGGNNVMLYFSCYNIFKQLFFLTEKMGTQISNKVPIGTWEPTWEQCL